MIRQIRWWLHSRGKFNGHELCQDKCWNVTSILNLRCCWMPSEIYVFKAGFVSKPGSSNRFCATWIGGRIISVVSNVVVCFNFFMFFYVFCFNLSSGGPYLDVGCRKLLISGMSPSTTEQDLRDYFDPFCKVMEAVIIPGIFVSGRMWETSEWQNRGFFRYDNGIKLQGLHNDIGQSRCKNNPCFAPKRILVKSLHFLSSGRRDRRF